jgi:hypothetical protein
MYKLPFFSVTSSRPSGKKLKAHGWLKEAISVATNGPRALAVLSKLQAVRSTIMKIANGNRTADFLRARLTKYKLAKIDGRSAAMSTTHVLNNEKRD